MPPGDEVNNSPLVPVLLLGLLRTVGPFENCGSGEHSSASSESEVSFAHTTARGDAPLSRTAEAEERSRVFADGDFSEFVEWRLAAS